MTQLLQKTFRFIKIMVIRSTTITKESKASQSLFILVPSITKILNRIFYSAVEASAQEITFVFQGTQNYPFQAPIVISLVTLVSQRRPMNWTSHNLRSPISVNVKSSTSWYKSHSNTRKHHDPLYNLHVPVM